MALQCILASPYAAEERPDAVAAGEEGEGKEADDDEEDDQADKVEHVEIAVAIPEMACLNFMAF